MTKLAGRLPCLSVTVCELMVGVALTAKPTAHVASLPVESLTVTVIVGEPGPPKLPGVGLCAMLSAARAVQLSKDCARTSSRTLGTGA